MSYTVLKQDLSEQVEYSSLNMLRLLFRKETELPSHDAIMEKLKKHFGNVDSVSCGKDMQSFALLDYMVTYDNGEQSPAMLLITVLPPVQEPIGDAITRTQFWNVEGGEELLDSCSYHIMISDFMSAGLSAQDRAQILSEWSEIILELYPECVAIFSPSSGKLLAAKEARENPLRGPARFIHFAVNARFFNIEGSDGDYLVDTLGLYALGCPDVQYHFHTLEPGDIVGHAYDLAIYQLENNIPIEPGNTVAGFEPELKWVCQYEDSLIQPIREVLDINTGEFSAGNRD